TGAPTSSASGAQGRATPEPAAPQALPAGRGGGRGGPPATGPVAYSVQVSPDGTTWGAPVAQGAGGTPTTVITFPPVRGRFVRVTQTGAAATTERWGIGQIRVYQAPGGNEAGSTR
nr:discoidin domain-containing protein [Acidobacteriota bacterium]